MVNGWSKLNEVFWSDNAWVQVARICSFHPFSIICYLNCKSRLLCPFFPDLLLVHARRVPALIPLVPVATLRLFHRLTDLQILEDHNQVSAYHKLISHFLLPCTLNVMIESKRTWLDTPFSLFTLQSTWVCLVFHCPFTKLLSSAFQALAPSSPAGMQTLLEHSVQNYHPLHSNLHSRHLRISLRPPPYPQSECQK